jgi:oligopeptidase B
MVALSISSRSKTETMSSSFSRTGASAPVAKRLPSRKVVHDVELVDDYAWLRAENWREVLRDPKALPQDISDVLRAENDYADAALAPLAGLRADLFREIRARIKEDDSDPPIPHGPWEYYQKFREGGEHVILCRRPRGGGDESILLDGDALAAGKDFFELHGAEQSPDHRLLAWSVDEAGSEFCTIRVRDLAAGRDADVVPDAEGSVVWTLDSRAFYYVRLDAEHRPSRVYRHELGEAADADELVFEEKDPAFFVHLGRSQSGAFALLDVNDHDSSEIYVIDLRQDSPKPRLIAEREPMTRYDVEHQEDDFIIRTNADDAEDFKIVAAPVANPQRAHWREVTPHRSGIMIVSHVAFKNHLVRLEREDGLPRIVVRTRASGEEHSIAFDEEAYSLWLQSLREYDVQSMRFSYSSMATPQEIYDYDMTRRLRVLVKRQDIPSGHDPARYVTRRVLATAADGERVPISLLYARETPLDGTAPLLLQGYGAYGHATPASFRASRLSLVDRGFVFAIAHVRGGTDRGRRWYLDGKLAKKPNTFSDFIAAARHLVESRFAREGRIVASGGSAGGMLMGAIANMAPQLFAGIMADVPFVDVLNTMLDADLPLTPPEWLEWGNPIQDRAAFATIRSYSPYDNVRPQIYPAILALAGLTDPRVTYWEPTKWVAKLRAVMTGGGPIFLKTNMQAGHGGASGRLRALEETALQYAFALACVTGGLAA